MAFSSEVVRISSERKEKEQENGVAERNNCFFAISSKTEFFLDILEVEKYSPIDILYVSAIVLVSSNGFK